MKKMLKSLVLVASSVLVLQSSGLALAGGQPNWAATLTPAVSSTYANGTSSITVSIYAYTYFCTNPPPSGPVSYPDPSECATHGYGTAGSAQPASYEGIYLSVSGVGTLASTYVSVNGNGDATTSIKSSAVGTATINAYWPTDNSIHGSTSVSFSAVPQPPHTPAPTATPKPKSTSSTSTSSPSSSPKPSASPTASSSPSPSALPGDPISVPPAQGVTTTFADQLTSHLALGVAVLLILVGVVLTLMRVNIIKLPKRK